MDRWGAHDDENDSPCGADNYIILFYVFVRHSSEHPMGMNFANTGPKSERGMRMDIYSTPGHTQIRIPTRTQAPALTSIFPKYAVLAAFLAVLFISWGAPRAWIWQECLSCLRLQATYHKNGIEFSYYRDWRVIEHENQNENAAPKPGGGGGHRKAGSAISLLPSSAVNIEGPHGAVIAFALFDPSYAKRLYTYADHMRIRFAAAMNDNTTMPDAGPLEPIVGQIHGANYDGFRYHFTAPSSMTSLTSRYQYFYALRTPANNIMLTIQLPEQYIDSPEVQLILDTLKLDGEINPADQQRRDH